MCAAVRAYDHGLAHLTVAPCGMLNVAPNIPRMNETMWALHGCLLFFLLVFRADLKTMAMVDPLCAALILFLWYHTMQVDLFCAGVVVMWAASPGLDCRHQLLV